MNSTEKTILKNLIHNEEYLRKVLPFVKDEYFTDTCERLVFNYIINFVLKYNKPPTIEALEVSLENSNVGEANYNSTKQIITSLKEDPKSNIEWLLDETEKFCKDKALYNAILRSISIIEGNDKVMAKDGIPSLLQEALGVCFNTSVGHDYIEDSSDRFEFYHRVESRLSFDIDLLNEITGGGLPPKTLNVILAGTGVGKTLCMCHVAACMLGQGKNVLYITNEMAEERIAERIDANLLNINVSELVNISKATFESRIKKISSRTHGKLIVKEYPTATAHVGHFRALLSELSLKRKFKPDIIFVDYLNICASSRFKAGGSGVNSYTYVKAIAEELRGLGVEFNVPVFTATQTTRSGYSNTDVELTDTSESFGLPATADFMIALITTEELERLNQVMVKQLKNRYRGIDGNKRFVIGIDKARMRLYNLESSAQDDIIKEQVFTQPSFKLNKDFSKINL